MAKADKLRAELEVAELEEELIKAKDTKAGPSRELKDALRDARRQQREGRQAERNGG